MEITSQMIIVLCILAFTIAMMISHLIPYGVTAMTACTLLALTGIFDIQTAFSGLSNSTTIIAATMFVIASAIGKTNFMRRMGERLLIIKEKGEFAIMLVLVLFTIVLSQLMGQLPGIMIVLVLIRALEGSTKLSSGRMLFVVCMISTVWCAKFPIATGATMPIITNSYIQNLVEPDQLLGLWDICKAGVIPAIAATLWCMAAHRLLPDRAVDSEQTDKAPAVDAIPKRDEFIILAVFLVVTVGFMASNVIGSKISNLLPALGVLVMLFTKVITVKETLASLTADLIWMIAGMQTLATAMSTTGVGNLIGNTILRMLGDNPSPTLVIAVFCIATTIMTNLMADWGTVSLMLPLAAATAQVAGLNVSTIAAVVTVSAWFAIALPTGSTSTMVAYGTGKYNPFETLKFTLPLVIICCVSLIISVPFLFPVFA